MLFVDTSFSNSNNSSSNALISGDVREEFWCFVSTNSFEFIVRFLISRSVFTSPVVLEDTWPHHLGVRFHLSSQMFSLTFHQVKTVNGELLSASRSTRKRNVGMMSQEFEGVWGDHSCNSNIVRLGYSGDRRTLSFFLFYPSSLPLALYLLFARSGTVFIGT